MEENRDGHAIVSNVIKSLEKGGSFSPSDRAKFARVSREHGIEGSVIEEVIDIAQTILEREAFVASLTRSMFPLLSSSMHKMMEVLNNNKDGSR